MPQPGWQAEIILHSGQFSLVKYTFQRRIDDATSSELLLRLRRRNEFLPILHMLRNSDADMVLNVLSLIKQSEYRK